MWNPPSNLFNPHGRGACRPLMLKDIATIYLLSLLCSALLISWAQEKMADESFPFYLSELLLSLMAKAWFSLTPMAVLNCIS